MKFPYLRVYFTFKKLQNTKSTAVVPNISEEDDSEQTEVIEEYYVEDGGKIRKIQLRQPSNCSVQGFGDISEEDMEVEVR